MKLMGDMSYVASKLEAIRVSKNTSPYALTWNAPLMDQLFLTLHDGTDMGIVNDRAASALRDIVGIPGVQYEALAPVTDLIDAVHRATNSSEAVVRVNINIYGPPESRNELGRTLSACKFYLQRPDRQRQGSLYDNPHRIHFPHIKFSETELTPYEMASEDGVAGSKLRDPDKFHNAVSGIYAMLKRSSKLDQVEGDQRLRTELLP